MLKHYLISFLISMVPLIELRGALPYALANGIPTLPAYIVCMVANMLPVPVIFFFARKVLEWGKDKKGIGPFFTFCLEKGHKAGRKLQEKAGTKGLFIALLLFVGIPLPGTGAWTGTLAASILDMDFKSSVVAVLLGVLLAAIIMGVAAFFGPLQALLVSLPSSIFGGCAAILYGYITLSGVRTIKDNNLDLNDNKIVTIIAAILTIGVSGVVCNFGVVSIGTTALAMIIGIILNLILRNGEKV